MNRVKFIPVTASFVFAIAFTISCTTAGSPTGNNDPGGGEQGNSTLSNSSFVSSSSAYVPPVQSSSSFRSSSSVYVPPAQSSSSSAGLCAGFVNGTTRLHYGKNKPQFCDERDGKKYVYVTIGGQTWMAENLNYEANGSMCANRNPDNCTLYGRMYSLDEAKTACPSGWVLPGFQNAPGVRGWQDFITSVGGETNSAEHLKATSGWGVNGNGCGPSGSGSSWLCEDTYGFSALPGGIDAIGQGIGYRGRWWTADSFNGTDGYCIYMSVTSPEAEKCEINKGNKLSVRCVKK